VVTIGVPNAIDSRAHIGVHSQREVMSIIFASFSIFSGFD
jgi:hypothetical protein